VAERRQTMSKNTTLDDVAAIIGFTAAAKLSAWFPNHVNLYVPITVDEDSRLTKLIGISAAKRLSENFPGEHLAIPSMSFYSREHRRAEIARMLEHEFSTADIAIHFAMSERRIQQIQRELEVAGLLRPVLGRGKAQAKTPQENG